MIQWVYERAKQARHLNNVIIATDDQRIFEAGLSFGANVKMTSPKHSTGTERAAEVALGLDSPIVINIQGDEPLVKGEQIDGLILALQDDSLPMATLAVKIKDMSHHPDQNRVKLVKDNQNNALYFSRSPIPNHASDFFWLHLGIYGYQKDFLLKFKDLEKTRLEKTEKLEQLRALENGYRIKVIETDFATLSVDTPTDIIKVENLLKETLND